MEPSSVKRRLTCILAADAVGYSKQMGQDEEGTIRVLSAHRAVIDGIIAFHQGRIVSTAGDSVLAEFSSAVEAVRCAVEIQDALKTRNDSLAEHRKMHFRVGVNLGDVVVKNDDLLGDGVNVAARLESMAEPGGICIASSVYDQITGKLDLGFQDIGEQSLKNISRPIHVYRVSGAVPPQRLASLAPPSAVPATSASARGSPPWAVAALVAVLIGALAAWQSGWLRFGTTALATAAPQSTPVSETHSAKTTDSGSAAVAPSKAVAAPIPVAAHPPPRAPVPPAIVVQPAVAPAATVAVVALENIPQPTVASVDRFNGSWSVRVDCPRHDDGALGYAVDFAAEVSAGVLRGEAGVEGTPGWLLLQGNIQADGNAALNAKGLTADPRLSVKSVQKGTPYAYQVTARFDGARGAGRRLQLRPCVLTFVKQ